MRCLLSCLCCAVCSLVVACGEVVTPDYRGDPLATLSGIVENRDDLRLPDDVNAYVVWLDAIGSGDAGELAASATVDTALPANFSLSLFHTPPVVAFGRFDDDSNITVALGTVVVTTTKQLTALAEGRPVRGVYGTATTTTVVWVPGPREAADLDARLDGAAVVEGFNLLQQTDAGLIVASLSTMIVVGLIDGGTP